MKLATQTLVSSLIAFVVFIALLVISSAGPAIYLGANDPAALERRMRGGPLAEYLTAQKIASSSRR
jgi:hypothetical protein